MSSVTEPNCLPMCSLCAKPPSSLLSALKRCGKCKRRTYCDKKCQVLDWKIAGHKQTCCIPHDEGNNHHGTPPHHKNSSTHEPWCAYLDRDPEIEDSCLVETGKVMVNPSQLITTGLNTCIYVVIKTKTRGMIGWHASIASDHGMSRARSLFSDIPKNDFVSGFIIPGEDRIKGSLHLKPSCRTMRVMPWTDPTSSKTKILSTLQDFDWYDRLEILAPVQSYKDFVVFDMAHKRPYVFSNTHLFDEGCTFDGNVDLPFLGY
jgi:hypothetical protein